MLTKEQILIRMRGFDCPKYLTESCWQPIYDQCVAAIDLFAENELLKAKAKHYVCIRDRNRETIDDLKGKLNASESENAQLKAELAEYAETFSEQNNALSDNIIANARLKAKLDAVRAECDKSMLVKNPLKHTECLNVIVDKLKSILAILDKDGDTDD